MPFKIVGQHVINSDTGQKKNKKPMGRTKLRRYLRALYANVPEARTEKAFNPGQKRAPKGSSNGGQWISSLLGGSSKPSGIDVDGNSDLRGVVDSVRKVHKIPSDASVSIKVNNNLMLRYGAPGIYHVGSKKIEIQSNGPYPYLTTAHEFGHFLDLGKLKHGKAYSKLNATIARSQTIQRMKRNNITGFVSHNGKKYLFGPGAFNNLLRQREIFARAYAQYVAIRSGSPKLLKDLRRRQKDPVGSQWSDKEFRPIMASMDGVLKEAGWK